MGSNPITVEIECFREYSKILCPVRIVANSSDFQSEDRSSILLRDTNLSIITLYLCHMSFLIEPYNAWQKPPKKKHWMEIAEEEHLFHYILMERLGQQQTQNDSNIDNGPGAGGVPPYSYFHNQEDNNMTLFGSGSPVGNVTPQSLNQLYIDQEASPNNYWLSNGLTNNDWISLTEGLYWLPNAPVLPGGTFSIINDAGSITSLSFPKVTSTVGSLNISGNTGNTSGLTSISAPSLSIIEGDFTLNGNTFLSTVDFLEVLTSIDGSLSIIENNPLLSINLSSLIDVDNITINTNGSASEILFNSLPTAGVVLIQGNGNVITINLSSLEQATSLNISENALLSVLDLSSLASTTDIDLHGNSDLVSLNLSALTSAANISIDGCSSLVNFLVPFLSGDCSVSATSCNSLETINVGSINILSGFSVPNATNLTNLYMTSATQISNFDINGCSSLTTLADTNLTSIYGNLDAHNCSSLTSIDWSPILSFDPSITSINFNGCALNETSVNYILARCMASNLSITTIDLSGGTNAPPTGQGITDADNLILNGCTVFINN